jgi:hypothetical protein
MSGRGGGAVCSPGAKLAGTGPKRLSEPLDGGVRRRQDGVRGFRVVRDRCLFFLLPGGGET